MSRNAPGRFVITGARSDAERFRRCDLHMIDVVRVPERLENRVGESQDEDVLRGFFAEEMVDAIGLLLVKELRNDAIEFARRGEIGAERFFDYDARPASFAGLVQAGGFQILEDRFELVRPGRQIKKTIAARAWLLSISSSRLASCL